MRRSRFSLFVTFLTAFVLFLTLPGFFITSESKLDETEVGPILLGFQQIFISWAIIIAAFAVILGSFTVLNHHRKKLISGTPGGFYGFVVILSGVLVLVIGLQEGPSGAIMSSIFIWVISPLHAASAALLPFILTYAAFRMLRRGYRGGSFVFFVSALVVMITQLPLPDLGPVFQDLREMWLSWLAVPGLRAVLIGVALGVTMTAWRLILGIDRPQG